MRISEAILYLFAPVLACALSREVLLEDETITVPRKERDRERGIRDENSPPFVNQFEVRHRHRKTVDALRGAASGRIPFDWERDPRRFSTGEASFRLGHKAGMQIGNTLKNMAGFRVAVNAGANVRGIAPSHNIDNRPPGFGASAIRPGGQGGILGSASSSTRIKNPLDSVAVVSSAYRKPPVEEISITTALKSRPARGKVPELRPVVSNPTVSAAATETPTLSMMCPPPPPPCRCYDHSDRPYATLGFSPAEIVSSTMSTNHWKSPRDPESIRTSASGRRERERDRQRLKQTDQLDNEVLVDVHVMPTVSILEDDNNNGEEITALVVDDNVAQRYGETARNIKVTTTSASTTSTTSSTAASTTSSSSENIRPQRSTKKLRNRTMRRRYYKSRI